MPVISSAISTLTLSLAIVALVGLYLLPTLVALARRIPGVSAIAVINILLGWSFIGWVIALALAVRSVPPAVPAVQVVQHFPPPPPAPGPLPDAGWARIGVTSGGICGSDLHLFAHTTGPSPTLAWPI